MSTSRGTSKEFDALHQRTLRILNKMLEAAENDMLAVGTDDEGKPLIGMPPPALLAQAIKFLKENGIDKPASDNERKDTLKDAMPDFDELEGKVVSINRK